MAAVLVSTLSAYDGLAAVVAAAAVAHEADAVATFAPFLGRTEFGVVAVDAQGRATLAETLAGKVIAW